MSSGDESNREEELAVVNLENVKRISETYRLRKGKGKNMKGTISKSVVQEIWKDRLSPRFYSRLMSVMFPEDSNEVSFLSFYTIYKNLAEPETEITYRALTIYHIATIHEPPFNYETAIEYPNASYKAIKDYVCDVITSYLHAIINFNMKEAHAWLSLKASNTLIDGNLATSYVLKDLETHRNDVSLGSLEIWLEKNEIYYTVSEQLYLFLFGVSSYANVKPLLPLPVVQTRKVNKTLLALPDVLLLNSKLRKRAQRWTLVYILDRHSQNWDTLKPAIHGKGQTIIVIQDANGDIFGMYGSQRWVPTDGFFGNDECFLFTLKPDVNIYEGSGRDNNFQLFNESGIGVGGTEDRPGLFIKSDTVGGKTSLACRTFREFWPLSRELEFKICQMEIWTVHGDETKKEEDVRELILNTQYMKMTSDEVYNKTTIANQPNVKHQCTIKDKTAPNPPGMSGPKCWGKCTMDTAMLRPEGDPRSAKYKQQGVCCSMRCPRRIKVASIDGNGEGDRNMVHAAHRFHCDQEEKQQSHQRHSIGETNMKPENYRKHRKSFDTKQKHGAEGFIHPSLAAEENERNAAKAAKKSANEGTKGNDSSIRTREPSNKTKPPKKGRLSYDGESSQKSYSPSSSLHNQTTCNTQTQVGECRLMKTTCRLYRPSLKCACIVKTTCACPQKFVSPSGNGKLVASSPPISSETSNKTKKSNVSNRPTTKIKKHQSAIVDVQDQRLNDKSTPTTDLLKESSISVENEKITMVIKDDIVAPLKPETNTQANKPKSPTKNEKQRKKFDRQAAVKIQTSSSGNSDVLSEHTMNTNTGNSEPLKEEENVALYPISDSYTTLNQIDDEAKVQTPPPKSVLPEMDCQCSSESVVNNCNPDSECSCQVKVSNYLKKTNKTTITDVSLSDISSSVCSCILEDKKITIASPGLPKTSPGKETQNLSKTRRKSDISAHSNLITANNVTKLNAKNLNTKSLKKETQHHLKSKRVSNTSADPSVPLIKYPRTCSSRKTLVGQHGYQCELEYTRKKMTTRETQNLTKSRRFSDSSSFSVTLSIQDSAVGMESPEYNRADNKSLKLDTDSESVFGSTSSRNDLRSSQSLRTPGKQAPKRKCGASCKCSLSPAYFPVFPEDFIKEKTEDCDCASFDELQFPVIVDTPPNVSRAPSIPTVEPENIQEPVAEDPKLKKCGCDDSDNTIIILNVSKCETAETVEKLIHDLEDKAGDPNIKSLLFKCKDLNENRPSPCSTKNEAEREALKQQIEKLLQKKNPPIQPGQEEH